MGTSRPNVLLAGLAVGAMASSLLLAILDTDAAVILAFLFAGVILAIFSVIEPRLEGHQQISLTQATINLAQNPELRRLTEEADLAIRTGLTLKSAQDVVE